MFAVFAAPNINAQKPLMLADRIQVVNMIPLSLSAEDGQDSEPNIAVDSANPRNIAASAFTRNPGGSLSRGPIFVSQDGGATWSLNSILPSGNGMTGDITLAYSTKGSVLYAGILLGGEQFRMNILRSPNPFGSNTMDVLVDSRGIDQPWVEARTASPAGPSTDRVFVGNNNRNFKIDVGGDGRTASIDISLDAAVASPPAGFSPVRIELRTTNLQDMPAVRTAVHGDGTVYAIFYRRVSGTRPNIVCDVTVTRDDNWASGASPFQALKDSGDSMVGMRVAQGVLVPAGFDGPPYLGSNRLAGSNLSIAVDPQNSSTVWIAWADQSGTGYTLHVRRSTDRGLTWSADLISVTNAINPALAINSVGQLGFLYQQLVGASPNQRWQTHLQRTDIGMTWSDLILADTPDDNNPLGTFQPYIGDYVDLVAVASAFYGVFSAKNNPNIDNFPNGVIYQRNVDFTTQTLLDTSGTNPVAPSIDPFFFSVGPPLIMDICKAAPHLCTRPLLRRGLIRIKCKVIPCRAIDPIPKNCMVKFACSGCRPGGLCPPWYNISLQGLDPEQWHVGIYRADGRATDYKMHHTTDGVVLSLKPTGKDFKRGSIGAYVLAFESDKIRAGQQFSFRTRLEMTSRPYGVK